MKQVLVHGTLGDCFCAGLKLINKKEDFYILHYTVHKYWYSLIRQIYSLFPNIKSVEFVDRHDKNISEVSGLPDQNMEFFPNLELPNILQLEEDYIIICPHAGREDMMARKIPTSTIEYMIDVLSPIKIVLLGTDLNYSTIQNCINLIGRTTITEAMSIIVDSSGFCGPEGCLSFVALSQKKDSIIFYVRRQPVEARLLNNEWTNYIIDLIKL